MPVNRLLRSVSRRLKRNAPEHEPSLADYTNEESLAAALKTDEPPKPTATGDTTAASDTNQDAANQKEEEQQQRQRQEEDGYSWQVDDEDDGYYYESQEQEEDKVEWTLKVIDEKVTKAQTMDDELQRLQDLQSYVVLDSEGEQDFDRITHLGSKLFDTPICLISLVDLGRQWFLSRHGLDAPETPRKFAFCAHCILNNQDTLIVPDATKDFRFQNNPLVTGGIKIRFYAGAALVSPQGHKLGTVCVISPKVRPEGLSDKEQETLHELAAMAVAAMVARRNRLLREEYEAKLHRTAAALLDTQHALQTTQQAVDEFVSSSGGDGGEGEEPSAETEQRKVGDLLNQVSETLTLQGKICAATARNIHQEVPAPPEPSEDGAEGQGSSDNKPRDRFAGFHQTPSAASVVAESHKTKKQQQQLQQPDVPATDMEKLFDNVNSMLSKFPIQESVSVEMHKSVPRMAQGVEDLLLFRAVWNMLLHCMGASSSSSSSSSSPSSSSSSRRRRSRAANEENNKSGLRIRATDEDGIPEIFVECFHGFGNRRVSAARAKEYFQSPDSALYLVARTVQSLGGRYGQFTGRWGHLFQEQMERSQSIYWFRIPYGSGDNIDNASSLEDVFLPKTLVKTHRVLFAEKKPSAEENLLLEEDPFLAQLLADECGGSSESLFYDPNRITRSRRRHDDRDEDDDGGDKDKNDDDIIIDEENKKAGGGSHHSSSSSSKKKTKKKSSSSSSKYEGDNVVDHGGNVGKKSSKHDKDNNNNNNNGDHRSAASSDEQEQNQRPRPRRSRSRRLNAD